MGKLNDVATLTKDREELIIRLCEMAGAFRSAHAAGAVVPVLCLLDCDPHHWTARGAADCCTNCGTRPLPADQWHSLLTAALRRCGRPAALEPLKRSTIPPERRAA